MNALFPEIDGIHRIALHIKTIGALIAVVGNLLIIFCFLQVKDKKLLTVPNLLLCLLAAVDTMVGFLASSSGFLCLKFGRWPGPAESFRFGFYRYTYWRGPYCTLFGFLLHLFCMWSMWTTTLIAWQRYTSVLWPMRYRPSFKKLLKYHACIGLCCVLYCCLGFAGGGYALDPSKTECYGIEVPTALSITTCIFAMGAVLSTMFFYQRMFAQMKTMLQCDGLSVVDHNRLTAEKRISKSFVLIASIFTLCAGPCGALWCVAATGFGNPKSKLWIQLNTWVFIALVYNSAANPVLMIATNRSVKKAVILLFQTTLSIKQLKSMKSRSLKSMKSGSQITPRIVTFKRRQIVIVKARRPRLNSETMPGNLCKAENSEQFLSQANPNC